MKPARRARSGRQSTPSSATESTAVATIASTVVGSIGRPSETLQKTPTKAPNIITSPYAKLTNRRIP